MRKISRRDFLRTAAGSALSVSPLWAVSAQEAHKQAKADRTPDVVFVPTPQDVVDKMLRLAQVTEDDLVYDLGCGDGRIVVTAAQQYGCKAVGYDIDPQRVQESRQNVQKNKVGHLVRIEQKDIFTLDLSEASVITLYLLPKLNVKLIPQLEKLKPGSRIVSHDFAMRGVEPDKVVKLTSEEDGAEHRIYLWTTPLKRTKRRNPPRTQPNIIFLLTDDQRADAMGCAGNPIIHTPNLDALAADGVRFTNAFVTTSICASSRASILSGQWVRRHGISDFATSFSDEALARTYPLLLKDAGYRTGFVGKYGVGRGRDFPGDEYDFWRGCPGQCSPYERKDENGNYKHLTQIMGDQALEFLQTCSEKQPFCLSVSFKAPHVQDADPRQFIYDRAYEDMYSDVTIPVPETAAPRYFEALPEFLRTSEARRRWQIRFSTPEKYQESVKGYYRLIAGVDVVVGRIREELARLGLDDNTVIVFSGDNGFYLGEHGLAGKWYPHEESIRVPLLVLDPRARRKHRGVTCGQFALNIDIAPTILELAAVPVPQQMQGQSLVPLLRGQTPEWRTEFFYEHPFNHPGIPKSEALRTQRYKYARYVDHDYEELYDLDSDPHETANLAGDKEYARVLTHLRKRCDELAQRAKGA